MSDPDEEVRLVVPSRQVLDVWTEYEFVQDVFTPANNFNFKLALADNDSEVPEEYLQLLCETAVEDAVVRLEVGQSRTLLGIGIIDSAAIEGDKAGEYIEIQGRDPASVLLDNEVSTKLHVGSGITLPALAEEILKRYRGHGIPFNIETSNDANRDVLTGKVRTAPGAGGKVVRTSRGAAPVNRPGRGDVPINFSAQKIADARPHPGETEWAFLERHAKNLGLLLWFSARGNLIIAQPDYNQPLRFELQRLRDDPGQTNNILSGGRHRTVAGTATAMHCLGHGSLYRQSTGKKVRRRKSREKIQQTVKSDRKTVFPREKFLKDAHVRSSAEAVRVARHELAQLNANAEVYQYKTATHAYASGSYYTVDTLGHLRDEIPRPAADLDIWTSRCAFNKSRGGTFTSLRATPKGAIQL